LLFSVTFEDNLLKKVRIFVCFLFLIWGNTAFSQHFYLQLSSENTTEQKIIDSLSYQKHHQNPKSVTDEVSDFSDRIIKLGYLQSRISSHQKINDTVFAFPIILGQKTDFVKISTSKALNLTEMNLVEADTIAVKFSEIESFMSSLMRKLEIEGYSMSKLNLENFSFENNILKADLIEQISSKRKLDDVVIMGYEKFPEGHRRQLKRMYKNRVFNQQTLSELHQDVQRFAFVNQLKQPEILFTRDSTRVFLYLEKSKASNFDGYVGFNTDENDEVTFTGYLDLLLNNALNTGEQFKLYWKNDGNQQQTFSFSGELPYLFNTPFALRGNLTIFKQDSTFQNTKTGLDLGYYIRYNIRTYLGYSSENSNDIQSQNSATLTDFKSKFFTSAFEYFELNRGDFLFPEKRNFVLKGGMGNRQSSFEDAGQFFVHLNGFNNFYLNEKNIISFKFDGYYLDSDSYVINELYRFGGINSIRGFNENSLQASLFSGMMVEYRYVLAPSIYVHSLTDFGYFQDKATDTEQNLLGIGFGLGLFTNNGLFNLVYANGSTDNQQIKLSNSIIHLSFRASF